MYLSHYFDETMGLSAESPTLGSSIWSVSAKIPFTPVRERKGELTMCVTGQVHRLALLDSSSSEGSNSLPEAALIPSQGHQCSCDLSTLR